MPSASSTASPTALAGVDIGGTKILGVLVSEDDPSAVLAEHRVATPAGAANVLDAIAEVARALGEPLRSLGVGIAGLVDREGVLKTAPNLANLRDVAIRDELLARLGCSVAVDNDATCAAWGEHVAGAARGQADAVCITLGTGIGAGLIANDEVVRGVHGFGGEAGHMVVDPNGPHCPCGRRGCWERMGSGSGLGRMARELAEAGRLPGPLELAGGDLHAIRGEHVAAAALEGDKQSLDLLRSFAWWVALGLGNLVTLLDAGVVVIGGGLIEIGEPLMGPVREHYGRLVMAPDQRSDVRIEAAELGERAGAIGAALLGGRRTAG